ARALFSGGVEVVELDYDVTETWDAAVQWADRVFLVPPPFDPRGDERLVPFLDWAVQSGAHHLVLLSAMGIEAREQLALRRIEQRIERTGVNWTLLRPNIYMQNFARGFVARSIRDEGVIRLPVDDAPVSFVDGRDVAALAAVILEDDAHFGRAYTLTGPEALTHHEVAATIGEVTGASVRYEPVSEADMRGVLGEAGWPGDQADTFAGLMAAIREGRRSEVTGEVEALLGRPPRSFRSFAEDHREAWV
ncbi:MAG: NmrA family NAD(P)-binding protein, partial [Gemmatimonadetes bacterium]|nr:NmrA family NAD(P)-binding protein [Gemmatimonadota bacterium]NIQ57105.1 NmrA family NAD(P)-binding protein [Gemmatimonadota bacterium]NIU77272.1 NmrA family NAD(P)-binding protein [Gammaproteobacteria bacterium]NIX46546.1 NmrA family NAD(P)-binding protein [Gemmatimonadota bacterium]NIY10864.1 NmrA family NAD(P)-binding protein [Gemmatimonadota bacterium]